MRAVLLFALQTAKCSIIPITQGPIDVIPRGLSTVCVFLVRWRGHELRPLPSRRDVDAQLNTGDLSARAWFREASHGESDVRFHVFDWVASAATELEAAEGSSGRGHALFPSLESALAHRSFDVSVCSPEDGGPFHAAVFHSGYDGTWAGVDAYGTGHRDRVMAQMVYYYATVASRFLRRVALQSVFWDIHNSTLFHRGTVLHELMHNFGLGDYCGGGGLGFFDMMCQNKGWRGDFLLPALGAPHRVYVGFSRRRQVSCSGDYPLSPATAAAKDVVLVLEQSADVVTMVELRRPIGLDAAVPCKGGECGGVLVWRVEGLRGISVVEFDGGSDLAAGVNRGDADDFGRTGDVLRTGKWTIAVVSLSALDAVVRLETDSC